MMPGNSKPTNSVLSSSKRSESAASSVKSLSLKPLAIFIFASLLISACGGGISGTGDGGPIVIVDPADTAGVADSADTISDSDSQDVEASPTESDMVVPSPDVSQLIPETLRLLNTRDENTSRAQPLAAQLNALQQEVNATLQSVNAVAGTPEESVSDTFDTTFRYQLNNTETVIAQSITTPSSYLFSSNDERVIYVLQQNNNLTVRYLNRFSNTLLQATVISLPDGITIIEADLNQNGIQSYIKTHSSASTTTVFEQHPTDPVITRQREIIDESGTIQTVQNCIAASQNCALDSSWSNTDPVTDAQFSANLNAIENNLTAVISPVSVLTDSVDEAVVTQLTNEVPTDEQILCGLQRVTESIRAFCVLPQPFGQTSLFSESLAGDEIFYQLLQ